MSIWGKLVGAAAGLTLGGPIGALVGAIAGHYAMDRRRAEPARLEGARGHAHAERQVAFTIGVIALGAKMAKADGHVTRNEVDAFRQVFHVPPGEAENVARVFNLAKQDVAGFEAYAAQLAQIFGPGSDVLEDVLDGLFHIAKADGGVLPSEMAFLEHVAKSFGFRGAEFDRIRARHVELDEGNPYTVLGISKQVNNDEVKRVYRQLVRENHPDRMIARGVPEEFVDIATARLAAINTAYATVRKERGI